MTLADRLAGRELTPKENYGMAKYLFDHVESMAFVQGAIVLRKKQAPLGAGQKLAAARALAAQSGGSNRQLGLLRVLSEFGGSLEERNRSSGP